MIDGYLYFNDGQYQVGEDIPPGTYRSLNPDDSCFWQRKAGASSDHAGAFGRGWAPPVVVTVMADDATFTSEGCGTWSSDLSRITASMTSFAAGTYIVGTDLVPGTYYSPGGDDCFWWRLSAFTGYSGDEIEDAWPSAPQTVTIPATDRGFTSHGCGIWTLVPGTAPSATASPIATPLPSPTDYALPSVSAASPGATLPKLITFSDGTYLVGENIPPGTYRANAPGNGCQWERSQDPDLKQPIGGYTTAPGSVVATILPDDPYFWSEGCGTWTNDLEQVTSRKMIFGDGTFIVGLDIAPGTYESSGGESCYWIRLSAFTGRRIDEIELGGWASPSTVTIKPGDEGFMSEHCGAWMPK
jgi:hypothetical protein